MFSLRSRLVMATALATCFTGIAPAALAQTSTTVADKDEGIGDIVVTATRREERLKDVPLSVSVLSGAAIDDGRIADFDDLSRSVPGFSNSSVGGPGTSNLQVRGISSKAGTATVAVYLDEVALLTRNSVFGGQVEPRFFDVERVEVLRGPQGTLFGASAMGGVIRFIQKAPKADEIEGEFFGELSGTKGGGVNYDAKAVLNVPLVTDKVAIRVGGEIGSNHGWIDYVQPVTGVVTPNNNENSWRVAKAAILLQPSDSFKIAPSVFYQEYRADNLDLINTNLPGNTASKMVREPGTDRLLIAALPITLDTDFATFTSVSSYYRRTYNRVLDGTAFTLPAQIAAYRTINPGLSTALSRLGIESDDQIFNKQFTQEFRISSPPGGDRKLNWTAGFYYQKENNNTLYQTFVRGLLETYAAFGVDPNDRAQPIRTFPNAFVRSNLPGYEGATQQSYAMYNYTTEQYAVFGEATYKPFDTLRITVGLRQVWATDELDQSRNYFGSACGVIGGPGCPALDQGRITSKALTPKFSISWDATPEVTVYATASKGFRLGGAAPGVPLSTPVLQDLAALAIDPANVPAGFQADTLWNYEAGLKTTFFGNRVAMNLSGFYIDWKNIQQTINLPRSGFSILTNAGNAEVYGFEFDGQFKLSNRFRMGVAAGYTRARLPDGIQLNGTLLLGSRPGAKVPGVPEWTLSGNAEYRLPLSDRAQLVFGGDVSYVGTSTGTLIVTDADFRRPAYTVANFSIGLEVDNFELSLFAKNAFDNDTIIQRPNSYYLGQGYRLTPRTIGLNGRISF